MSTIHAFTTPARGHLYPLTPVLLELSRRGHRVKVWTLAGEVDSLRSMGLDAEAMSPAIEALPFEDWRAEKPAATVQHTFERQLERAPHEIADINAAIAVDRPDLLITDINAFGGPAAAEASGIPWLSFSPFFSWLPDEGIPPFGPGMERRPGLLGKLRDRVIWKAITRDLNKRYLGDLNGIREAVGVDRFESLTDLWTRPPALLYTTVPELEYPRPSLPASWHYVGPCRWEPPGPTPRWLDGIDKPLVLLTASTEYQADEELISTALETLAGEDVFVVATTAGNDPERFSPPPNSRVERFLPHAPLLEAAEVVICHGGMGITQKALAAGVPVCTVAWGRDQLESGRRVEAAGAGSMLPRKRFNGPALLRAYRQARARRSGAERIAAAIAKSPGAAGAADVAEAMLPAGAASPAG